MRGTKAQDSGNSVTSSGAHKETPLSDKAHNADVHVALARSPIGSTHLLTVHLLHPRPRAVSHPQSTLTHTSYTLTRTRTPRPHVQRRTLMFQKICQKPDTVARTRVIRLRVQRKGDVTLTTHRVTSTQVPRLHVRRTDYSNTSPQAQSPPRQDTTTTVVRQGRQAPS